MGVQKGSKRGQDGVQLGVQIEGSTFCTDPLSPYEKKMSNAREN